MPDALSFYLKKIQRLRVDRSHGIPAPHKPILLLALIDLIEQGAVHENEIKPSPQLVESYLKYWSRIRTTPPRVYLPFYHLKSSGFWHLKAKAGQESLLAAVHQFNSLHQLTQIVDCARLDDELFKLLMNPTSRELIRQAIIDAYFSEQRNLISSLVEENRNIYGLENLLLKNAESSRSNDSKNIPETPLRSAAFRGVIMKLYNYTCAACRLRIITIDGAAAVDAAHIVPFSESHDDSVGNGLALCKLHHWAFDLGLLAIDDSYKLLVSTSFDEEGPSEFLLNNLRNKKMLLPPQKPFFPSLQAVRHHRERKFQR
ncbi:MAG TPA: HNH endonuclease [Blastocatellia bacterium]